MVTLRPSADRGRSNLGWLDSRHTFSFGNYYDPRHEHFRALRVINEDRVAPGAGFGIHEHEDMEILSYVLEGALEHKDSMGNGSVIRPGELQIMSAGTGVQHSEHNHSKKDPVHFLQIWLFPERTGLEPSYEQRSFPLQGNRGKWVLLASRDGRQGSLTLHQDVSLYAGALAARGELVHRLEPGRHGWVQLARGRVMLNGAEMEAGDGAGVSNETVVRLSAVEDAEVLLFDLA